MKVILSKDATFKELFKFFISYKLNNFYTDFKEYNSITIYYNNIEAEVFSLYRELNIIYKDENKEEILKYCSDFIVIPDLEDVLGYCWIRHCGYCRTIGSVFYDMSSGFSKVNITSALKALEQKFNTEKDIIQDYEYELHKLLSNTFEEYEY